MPVKKTTEQFIEEARKVHGNKYNYSKVQYVNNCTKVCIICPEHGEFWQQPNSHLNGNGCPECAGLKRWTTEKFIEEARKIHGNKYIYSNVDYINKRTNVIITCPIHGDFIQNPHNHISQRQGCPECGKIIARQRTMDCKNHRKTKEEFQKEINLLYCGKYEVIGEYINNKTKIAIYCHEKNKNGKEHGIFFVKPNDLICGHGCHRCIKSKLEQEIENFLVENYFNFEPQKHFKWLGRQSLDYYLTDYNIAIECQGIQHFIPIDFKGKKDSSVLKSFNVLIERDKKKKELCEKNGVYLLYYANYEYDFPYEVITNKQELLTKILSRND